MSDEHDHQDGPTPEHALWVAIVLNATFLALEAAVGWWTGSLALLSDAGHMVSDVGALAIALAAVRLSTRTPSSGYTFGLRRLPVLGALVNAGSLIAIVVLIGVEAYDRFGNPPQIDGIAVLGTGIAGLAVNLVSAWYLARSRDESVNTRGAILHLLSDALGSIAAIVSALAVLFFDARLADPIASVVIAVLILVGSWPLLRDTVRILLQRAPMNIDVDAVRDVMESEGGILAIADLHIWGLDVGQPVLTAVLLAETVDLTEANALTDRLRAKLREQFGIDHVTLELRHEGAAPTASFKSR